MTQQWKPISSAPKDGSTVLLRGKGDHRIADGYWLQAACNGNGDWVWPYLRSEPIHWMPLPAAPGTPPASAQPQRDWELTCDHCNGDGFVYAERQVAERKSDAQEFKEECEVCEGRGFAIAFEDIPGIAEYVRKSRPVASAQDDAKDERQAFATWHKREFGDFVADVANHYNRWLGWKGHASVAALAAPAAGDARDSERLEWIARNAWAIRDLENGRKNALVWQQPRTAPEGALYRLRGAIDAARAAYQQQEG